MNYRFENGAIVVEGKLFEHAVYDVSNATFSATFNGNGGVTEYFIANGEKYKLNKFASIAYNDVMQNALLDKKVTMLGRRQTIEINLKTAVLEIEQFLDEKENGIFVSYKLHTDRKDDKVQVSLSRYPKFKEDYIKGNNVFQYETNTFASSSLCEYCHENRALIITLTSEEPVVNTFLACGIIPEHVENYIEKFDAYRTALEKEIAEIKVPAGLTEEERALFYSAYYCSLENYKELGDYKAFMAGGRYLSPMRSYYRDSYFTVLPMYNGNLDKVRSQIFALAKGIDADGTCPSAVKWDWSAWWGNHYDSPSFLSMMLYDYIKFTGDVAYADTSVGNVTILEQAVKALETLAKCADETGLLYKEGKYNKRDWADEVNRYGYVAYDEILYARALYSIAKIYELRGEEALSEAYFERFETVKNAINEILWDEELGYYVNFKNEDYTEKNLSVDTVFAAIFGIADEERSKTMLSKMEQLLESQNNGTPEPFGCMCVYPFYSRIDSANHKSSQSYDYHNGSNWPYLTAMYAYAKRKFGMEYKYLLTDWFTYNLKKGNYTPIEYFSPYCEDGSLLQAWGGDAAFVLDEDISRDFW